MGVIGRGLSWLHGRYRVRLLLRAAGRLGEIARYAGVRAREESSFFILSTQRNAGADIIGCLDSVAAQRYPPTRMRHLVIDDDSDDGTGEMIRSWCARHPDAPVETVFNDRRLGGTHNTVHGFRRADPDAIVIELNGDDRLADPGVLRFLDKVYRDPGVWMTYNTQLESTGVIPFQLPPPRAVRRDRSYRQAAWATSHLHSFRRRLFDHVPDEVMIDPATGRYWESADDVALYLTMLELAGDHARHIWRITYWYNFHDQTEFRLDRQGQLDRARRIRSQPKAAALESL